MLVSSPSMYCMTTGVKSSKKALWNSPSFMVASVSVCVSECVSVCVCVCVCVCVGER